MDDDRYGHRSLIGTIKRQFGGSVQESTMPEEEETGSSLQETIQATGNKVIQRRSG